MSTTTTPARGAPRITFTAMCEFLRATPVRQISIVREQKYPSDGPVKSYVSAVHRIVDYAVNATPLDPADPDLRPHERELIEQAVTNGWTCPAPCAERTPTNLPSLVLNGVEISMYPDLLLGDGGTRTGALKLYCGKTRELDGQAGVWMASLIYYYRSQVVCDRTVHPDLCIVSDIRRNLTYRASRNHQRLLQNVAGAARIIGALWPQV